VCGSCALSAGLQLGENVTDEELQQMVAEADSDGDGKVSLEDFIKIMRTPLD